ncbi:MAG: hypothetical protein NTU47_16765 [Ignavibacteriales bacterium]|nr:hypothetical protein [Ignavibacteriales bacterium]
MEVALLVPVVGYAASQIAFSYLYGWLLNSQRAAIGVSLIAASLGIVCLVIWVFAPSRLRDSSRSLVPSKSDRTLLLALAGIVVLSSWLYIYLGETHYYHSGNEDFFDAIEGGEAFIQNRPLEQLQNDYKGDIRLQYTSQAFWRLVLGVNGMDGFALQSILNLLLTATSVYWLVRYVLGVLPRASSLLAFLSVAANFYFTTYLAGHVGSMMYGSVAPVLLGLVLAWGQRKLSAVWLMMAALLFGFLSITYPGPFTFLLLPLIAWLLHERLFKPLDLWRRIAAIIGIETSTQTGFRIQPRHLWRLIILATLVVVVSIGLVDWARLYLQEHKLYQALVLRTRVTWRIAFEKEIWTILWGLCPSNLVGTASFLPFFVQNPRLGETALAIALILSGLTFVAAWSLKSKTEFQYFFLYVFLIPAFYLMMANFWGSPYYTYKFLYTNFFVVVIALGVWLIDRVSSAAGWRKVLWLAIPILVISVNLLWDVSRAVQLIERPYHQRAKIADFRSQFKDDRLRTDAIDIPDPTDALVVGYILQRQWFSTQPRTTAPELVQLEKEKSVAYSTLGRDSVIYTNGMLRMIKRPSSDDIILTSNYGTDHFWPWRITWVGNEITDLSVTFGQFVREAVDFVKKSGNGNQTYVDMRMPHIYALISREIKNQGLVLQDDPMKAIWFLRQKFTRFSPDWQVRTQTYLKATGNEKVVYENRMFAVVERPQGPPRFSPVVSPNIEETTLATMLRAIRERGNAVYIDMPPNELITASVRQFLLDKGVSVVEAHRTTLFLRLSIHSGLESFRFRSFMHTNEETIWLNPDWENTSRRVTVGLRLVKVPLEGRIQMDTRALQSIRYWYLTAGGAFDFCVSLLNLSDRAHYLRLLVAPGPGIDFTSFDLLLRASDERILKRWPVSGASACIDVRLDDSTLISRKASVLNFEGENLIGHSLLPSDERLLNYGVLAVELTDSIDHYSEEMLAALNPRVRLHFDVLQSKLAALDNYYDIVEEKSKEKLWLGVGWYDVETQNDRPFRWVGRSAQFVVVNPSPSMRFLNIDLEQGPSLKGKETLVDVIQDGKIIDKFSLTGRITKKVELKRVTGNQSLVVIQVEESGRKIPQDPRRLDFRVFEASLSPQ